MPEQISSYRSAMVKANRWLPAMLLVGLALGIANFALGVWSSLGQSIALQMVISVVIGWNILWLSYYHHSLREKASKYYRLFVLLLAFAVVGVVGTAIQALANTLLFNTDLTLIDQLGVYAFNAILSMVLGYQVAAWVGGQVVQTKAQITEQNERPSAFRIPVKHKDGVVFYERSQIAYFEAYDNYAFLYTKEGERQLCQYSLLTLEQKTGPPFLRVHRKYLVNTEQVQRIAPHLKGRFVLHFRHPALTSITTGATYNEAVKALLDW